MADWRGRWVAVNFFSSWCTPCIQEHPELVAFDEAHREAGDAAVVSVTYDDRTDDAKEFFAKRGGDWPVVDDPENSIGVAYGVARVPETFLRSEEHTSELQSLMRISYAVFCLKKKKKSKAKTD